MSCFSQSTLAFVLTTVLAMSLDGATAAGDTGPRDDAPPAATRPVADDLTTHTFLDRLMHAESGGRDFAANPRSTAVGPFQFIKGTFLYVARRHLHEETGALSDTQVLALRTDRAFARRAAEAYVKDSAALLSASGFDPTFVRLRLAFLVGPNAAIQILRATPVTPLAQLLNPAVLRANPFMIGMTASGLVARSARDITARPESVVKLDVPVGTARFAAGPGVPALEVRCERTLASCKRWIALQTRKLIVEQKRGVGRLVKGKSDGGGV